MAVPVSVDSRGLAALIGVGLTVTPLEAGAQRPTEGGLWSFAPDDEVVAYEEPSARVRVHYSVAGPNLTHLDDLDVDGVPDYVADVSAVALEALDFYEGLGFRPPLSEADLDLGPLGGSEAFDIYLVDFQGNADALFSTDACSAAPRHCAGWVALDNDFVGYGYPSIEAALDTVVVHEIFHAVQAAYDGGQPTWFSEGTAVWAQRMFWPASPDFIAKCDAYLELIDRPIDKPPAGPVQAFAYGTALFWWFLHARHGGAVDVALQAASESPEGGEVDLIAGISTVLAQAGDELGDAWFAFAQANLASGPRTGALEGHAFGPELEGIMATEEGPTIDAEELRFSPLAARYFRLEHAGGPLAAGVDTVHEDLRFSLHPVVGGALDGPVEAALIEWRADVSRTVELGVFPPGGYWVVGSLAAALSSTAKTRLCLGPKSFVEACYGDGGGEGEGTGTGTGGEETGSGGEDDTGGGEVGFMDAPEGGCACRTTAQTPKPSTPILVALLGLVWAGRRRVS